MRTICWSICINKSRLLFWFFSPLFHTRTIIKMIVFIIAAILFILVAVIILMVAIIVARLCEEDDGEESLEIPSFANSPLLKDINDEYNNRLASPSSASSSNGGSTGSSTDSSENSLMRIEGKSIRRRRRHKRHHSNASKKKRSYFGASSFIGKRFFSRFNKFNSVNDANNHRHDADQEINQIVSTNIDDKQIIILIIINCQTSSSLNHRLCLQHRRE